VGTRADRDTEFRAFFIAAGPSLRRTAAMVVGDWHLAEDMTQQAMAKVYSAWPRVRPETRTSFARKVVINECLSFLRRKRPEVVGMSREQAQSQQVAAEAVDSDAPDMLALLGRLAPRQRAVIVLRFLDDLSVAETARALRISEGTVKSQTSRALATLRVVMPRLDAHETEEARS
jgi:RNA polymerase sigma-70 factor (sigma-E family)